MEWFQTKVVSIGGDNGLSRSVMVLWRFSGISFRTLFGKLYIAQSSHLLGPEVGRIELYKTLRGPFLPIFLFVVVFLLTPPAAHAFSGSGTEDDPYQITNVDELQDMENDLDAHYVLMNDIDASETEDWNGGEGFDPIGGSGNRFEGTFNGNCHVIHDLYIDTDRSIGHVALFAQAQYSVIENVGLEDVNINYAGSYTGGLIGWNDGRVSNCYVTGTVEGNLYTGGLITHNADDVNNCYSTATVTSRYAGGLICLNEGSVSNCYSSGSTTGSTDAGGLIYLNGNSVTNCFWDVNTSGLNTSSGGTGKTTDNMMDVRTFTDTSWSDGLDSPWDFVCDPNDDTGSEDVWDIDDGVSYPFLAWGASEAGVLKSTDVSGDEKDSFDIHEDVYALGTGLCPNTTYTIYIVDNGGWTGGEILTGENVCPTVTTTTDGSGDFGPDLAWQSPLAPGHFDVIADDGDGLYNGSSDYLDDMDVSGSGFFVVPEPVPILAMFACFAALAGVSLKRRGIN